MPPTTLDELLRELRDLCPRLGSAKDPDKEWSHLRKVLEAVQPSMIEGKVRSEQVGALYVLREFVGDVCYNVLNGDFRRREPLESYIEPGFRTMTARICEFVQCALLGSAEGEPLAKLGDALKQLQSVVVTIDSHAEGASHNEEGA